MNRIKDLIRTLNYHIDLYNQGFTCISDEEWDAMYFELVKLEKDTGIIYPDSPTQTIQYKSVSKLEKVAHNHPMLSLDKTKDPKGVESFVNQSSYKETNGWCAMFKLDGLTCSLTYEDGKLVKAETRGNGTIGEDITHNAFVISSIPKEIPNKELTIIDGEIICKINDFNLYFANDYKNPRNFASGSIRLLNATECASRRLVFIAWDLIKGCDDIDFFFWRLEKLDDWGFITVPRVGDAETVHDAIEILDDMHNGVDTYKEDIYKYYPIDGYVFRFESQKYYNSLGATNHHFRGAIAYKFYDEDYETTLKDIVYDVSRTGILTPVAVFEPIEIDGSIVERASLHNMSIMEELLGTPYFGQHIWVRKSNMIIPQITKADKKEVSEILSAGGVLLDSDVVCPICGSATKIMISDSGVKVLYCDNDECEGKLAQRIDHFCGKKGLDIKGFSRKTIEKLIDYGWINGLSDIFRLKQHKTEWVSKEGFGETSVGKILLSIDAARSGAKMENFLSAIGIPLIGRTIAKEIVKYYSTWGEFREAVGGDWTEFEGFGPEISKAINTFDYWEADKIAELLTFSSEEKIEEKNNKAKDLIFVITGKLSRKRDDIKLDIENSGGKVTNSVSSKTNYLVCNDKNSTTGKSAEAKRLNIPVITEEELIKLIK